MVPPRQNETTWQRVVRVIRAELVFYPGRASLMARIVLACTVVMILIMVFRMPGAALGAYYPMLLSWDNPRATRRSALRTSVVCILGTAEIIVGAMFFVGSPFLHLVWVAISLFAVFYLISSMRLYDAALALGLIIATGINTWDLPLSVESRLTLTLYTMLSILIGCAVSVAIEYLFAQTHSPDAVLEGIRERLALVGKLLEGHAEGDTDNYRIRIQLSGLATRGTGQLRERLAHSNYAARYRERLAAALALSDRIAGLASKIEELDARSAAEDRARCAVVSANITAINAHLSREEAPDFLTLSEIALSYTPLLIEVERNVDLLSECFSDEEHPFRYHLPEPGEGRRLPILCVDAFTNKEHLRFAIRGTLSALGCYLVYMSVGWSGLGASTATCVLTALGNTGASRHKQLMRFAGVILGACIIGFATQAIILPQIDSLFAFMILFASVIGVGAWVGTSGPRIAYAGAQIVLAYDLVNLNRFTITTSLVPARDTVLGIMLGIFAMWLIFDHLWAKTSTDSMQKLFLAAFREIAELKLAADPLSTGAQSRRLLAQSERINAHLDKVRNLADVSVFEPYSKAGDDAWSGESIKMLLPQLRCFLLLKAGLLQHQLISEPSDVDEGAVVVQRASTILLDTAQILESGRRNVTVDVEDTASVTSAIEPVVAHTMPDDPALRFHALLSSSLINVARHLRAESLLLVSSREESGNGAGRVVGRETFA